KMQAIDKADRQRTAVEQFIEPARGKELVAGFSEDMGLRLERKVHGRSRIDSDCHGRRLHLGEGFTEKDPDFDYRFRRQRAVQSCEPNQIIVSRETQPGKTGVSLGQIWIESKSCMII